MLALFLFTTAAAFSAELPAIPADSIAIKKEVLFSDDFEGAEPASHFFAVSLLVFNHSRHFACHSSHNGPLPHPRP